MSKMLKTHQNTIGNLVIALLFVGGCIFLLTGSWDTSESEAAKGGCGGDTTVSSCCGGSTTLVAETTGGGCGSANTVSDSDTYKCDCLDPGNEDANCGACEEDPDNEDSECGGDTDTQVCKDGCGGLKCGPPEGGGEKCNGDDFSSVCNNASDKSGCNGDEYGCSKD